MRRSQQLKMEKELNRRYGPMLENMEPYYHHLDLRPLSDMDDFAFAYIMQKVKGVNMLDLNETEISNESIKLISQLEYVTELRLKGCRLLDDGCIADLNNINGLEFLYVKSTGITIDGLLQLDNLPQLDRLYFSADDVLAIKEEMLLLKQQFPGCEFVIDGKPYYFEKEDGEY